MPEGYILPEQNGSGTEEALPDCVTSFTLVLGRDGHWGISLDPNPLISRDRDPTPHDLIPGCSSILAEQQASMAAGFGVQMQMQMAQQMASQQQAAKILENLNQRGPRG